MKASGDEYYSERLPDGRVAIFLKGGKMPRLHMSRVAQARWDKANYVTLSTRVPVRTARRFAAECQRNGQTVYAALRAWPTDQAGRWSRGTHPAERRPQAGQVVVLPNGCPPSACPLIVPPGQGLRLAPVTVQRNKWQSLRAPSLRSVGLSPLPFVSGPRGSPSLRAGHGPSFAHPAAGRPPLDSGLLIGSSRPLRKAAAARP